MKIQMICVGKIKETYLRELIDHYTKIIRKKYNFEIIELPDEKTPDNGNSEGREYSVIPRKRYISNYKEV